MFHEVVQVAAGLSACLLPGLKAVATRSSISGDAGGICSLVFTTVRYEKFIMRRKPRILMPVAGLPIFSFGSVGKLGIRENPIFEESRTCAHTR